MRSVKEGGCICSHAASNNCIWLPAKRLHIYANWAEGKYEYSKHKNTELDWSKHWWCSEPGQPYNLSTDTHRMYVPMVVAFALSTREEEVSSLCCKEDQSEPTDTHSLPPSLTHSPTRAARVDKKHCSSINSHTAWQ